MKTLDQLRKQSPPMDLLEVIRHIEDDIWKAEPGDPMFQAITEIVAKYYPPNPWNRIPTKKVEK
jgi:hypothetical protein